MTDRELNWVGNSIYTIAAIYETDAAAEECGAGLVNWAYLEAASRAETTEMEKDEAYHASL